MIIILRGAPGAGKSTLAQTVYVPNGYIHMESDRFFMKDKVYKFDPTKLREAHNWCQNETRFHLSQGKNVVVSNTFTKLWEMDAYLDMAYKLDCELEVIRVIGPWKNVHNVPDDVIKRMKAQYEPYNGERVIDNSHLATP